MANRLDRLRLAVVLCAVLGSGALTAYGQVDTVHTWTNNYGSGDYNWFTATNWSPNTVPVAATPPISTRTVDSSHYVTINTANTTAYTAALTLGTSSGDAGYLYMGPNAGSGGLIRPARIYLGKDGTATVVQSGGTVDNYSPAVPTTFTSGSGTGSRSITSRAGPLDPRRVHRSGPRRYRQRVLRPIRRRQPHRPQSATAMALRDLFIGYAAVPARVPAPIAWKARANCTWRTRTATSTSATTTAATTPPGGLSGSAAAASRSALAVAAAMVLDPNRTDNTLAMGYNFSIANLQSGGLIPIQNLEQRDPGDHERRHRFGGQRRQCLAVLPQDRNDRPVAERATRPAGP